MRWFAKRSVRPTRSFQPSLEMLETRLAPATLVNATTLTYQDTDGDNVTVKFSKPILNASLVNSIFTFNPGMVIGEQLQKIDLAVVVTEAAGLTITTKAVKHPDSGGDGFAHVGEIVATGIDLGAIVLDGDLGRIHVGDGDADTTGLHALTARSMGRYATITGAPDLHSVFKGNLDLLKIKGDIKGAFIVAEDEIGTITVGGSLIGNGANDSARILANAIGLATIKGDVVGGDGTDTGQIAANTITGVRIGGSLVGGGISSGTIFCKGSLGAVKIAGSVIGGFGEDSGQIYGKDQIVSITIGGSLHGGSGLFSGVIFCASGSVGPVLINGSMIGGDGVNSGHIDALTGIERVTIGGSMLGGTGTFSAEISTGGSTAVIGPVKIKGDLAGGLGPGSGRILGHQIVKLTVGGSFTGGTGSSSGEIHSGGDLGPIKIGGDMVGGNDLFGAHSCEINSGGKIASLVIGGSLIGGAAFRNGSIDADGDIGAIRIRGSLVGGGSPGMAESTAQIASLGQIASVTIGGSLVGGDSKNSGHIDAAGAIGPVTIGGSLLGGAGMHSGQISPGSTLGAVKVKGNVAGGTGDYSGLIVSSGPMTSLKIGGSLLGGAGLQSGRVDAIGSLGFVQVKGDVVGGSGSQAGRIVAYQIASLAIGGSLRGGTGHSSGGILTLSSFGTGKIRGDVIGGMGQISGAIVIDGSITTLTIGGSLHGGSGNGSGAITASGPIQVLALKGDVVGGSAMGTAELIHTGFIQAQRIARLTIGGSVIAGEDATLGDFYNNGGIRVFDDLEKVTIKRSLIGNFTNPVIISARGQLLPTAPADVAIGTLKVLGRVEHALILAGVDTVGTAVNADAQIGTVIVGRDWIASSIAAGADPGADGYFGNSNDAPMSGVKNDAGIFSQISSLQIGGQVLGTVGGMDHFGIVAQVVGAVTVGGTPLILKVGPFNDTQFIGITGDFKLNEIAIP